METSIKATPEVVRDYGRLFVNRGAYTLQSSRPHPESGRHYYFRPTAKGTGKELSLSAATIRRHLHELGYVWKRPRYVLPPDPQQEKKNSHSPEA